MRNIGIYIWSILQTNPMVVRAWVVSELRTLQGDDGIIFHVRGLKFVGFVKIVYDLGDDLFNIFYIDDDGETQKIQKGVCVDRLVLVINEAVEKTDNYASDLKRLIVLC